MNGQLGFSVSCYRGDIPLLRGCLESIRTFAPDAPISLTVDGNFSTKNFEKHYGVIPIARNSVRNTDLKKWSFGYGITKMIAFWEAPFDIVLHIDADAVMWGDIRQNLPTSYYDVVHNEPHEEITPFIQKTQYFDPTKIFDYIPAFHWENRDYFNTGVVCIRRDTLDLDEYLRMLEVQRKHPDIFITGEQGMLNILVFRGVDENKIVAQGAHLQTVVPVCNKADLDRQFKFDKKVPIAGISPTIVHWAGPKPWTDCNDVHRSTMDFFRDESAKRLLRGRFLPAKMVRRLDEFNHRTVPRRIKQFKTLLKKSL
jgi:hypothetical protein